MRSRDRWLAIGLGVGAAVAAGVAWFYRDPERQAPERPDLCLAPADGQVVEVTEAGGRSEIAIFLSLWDVHVQRSPVAGTVVASRRVPGPRWPAMFHQAAANGGHELEIESEHGRVGVRRLAGLMAGRVTTRVSVGDRLAAGQRIGRIHLGSRAVLQLPAGFRVLVRPGDRVRAGETPVAGRKRK